MSRIPMKTLLEAGVHFGHQKRRWNPKMKPYIFGERNGIYIIDLQKTLRHLEEAYEFVRELVRQGGFLLFVGTKRQARQPVEEAAKRCGMYYVTQRWLGGMLTNWRTIRQRIDRLRELERMEEEGTLERLPKKEAMQLRKEREKLEQVLAGVREMPGLPSALFVVDVRVEANAVREAKKLRIPVIGIVDTNCDPEPIDYVIPANDDAIRSITLIIQFIADAVLEGKQQREKEMVEEVGAVAGLEVAPEEAVAEEAPALEGEEEGLPIWEPSELEEVAAQWAEEGLEVEEEPGQEEEGIPLSQDPARKEEH